MQNKRVTTAARQTQTPEKRPYARSVNRQSQGQGVSRNHKNQELEKNFERLIASIEQINRGLQNRVLSS